MIMGSGLASFVKQRRNKTREKKMRIRNSPEYISEPWGCVKTQKNEERTLN